MGEHKIKEAARKMKEENGSDIQAYYAGKNDRYLEEDNLMFKKVQQCVDAVTAPRKVWRKALADALLVICIQNQETKSMLRKINDRLDERWG